ncbi:RNA polymerase sigma factor SigA [bacterium HR15]|nr:RNA polymerase sigma factor SigA [bacterium HR15]
MFASQGYYIEDEPLIDDYSEQDEGMEQGLRGSTLDSVLGHALRQPLLSAEEELELLQRAKAGDEEARNRLVECNLRLVLSVARRYVRPGLALEDLVQEGAIGLIKAIHHFDLDRGLRFSTYATWWIRQAIGRAADSQSGLIRLPNHAIESLRRIERARAELRLMNGEEPTPDQIAAHLGMPLSKVHRLLKYTQMHLSLDQKADAEQDAPLGALLSNPEEEDPETVAFYRVWLSELLELAKKYLTPRECWAIHRWLGLEVSEVPPGCVTRLSRERMRQLERRAIEKFRALAYQHYYAPSDG